MRSRPALYLLTTFVAVATGLAFLGAALTVGTSRVADPRAVATDAVVRAFYAAVTETIRTGDAAALEAVVAADLVTHGSSATVAPGRDGLTRYLTTLHRTTPDVAVKVEQVVAAGDRAVAHLAVSGGGEGTFLGLPLDGGPPVWGTVDAVRVAGRRVVEHWSGAGGLALREPLGQTVLGTPPSGEPVVTLARLTLPPGGRFEAESVEELLLYVDAGAVLVVIEPRGLPSAPPTSLTFPATTATLAAGDLFTAPQRSRTELRNTGSMETALLITTLLPAGDFYLPELSLDPGEVYEWLIGSSWEVTDGAHIQPLAGGLATQLPAERPVVAIGRVTLAPGAVLPLAEATGPRLLAVEQGALRLRAGNVPAWVRRGDWNRSGTLAAGTLAAGDGAQFHAGTVMALDNPGLEPVVMTIVAFLPSRPRT